MLESAKVAVTRTLQSPSLFGTTSADSTSANLLNSSVINSAFLRLIDWGNPRWVLDFNCARLQLRRSLSFRH